MALCVCVCASPLGISDLRKNPTFCSVWPIRETLVVKFFTGLSPGLQNEKDGPRELSTRSEGGDWNQQNRMIQPGLNFGKRFLVCGVLCSENRTRRGPVKFPVGCSSW